MFVVVVGCGRVGAQVARALVDDGHDVNVIDQNAEALQRRLQVMDSTAFSLCLDNKMPIVVNGLGVVVLIILLMQMVALELKRFGCVALGLVVLYVLNNGLDVVLQESWID